MPDLWIASKVKVSFYLTVNRKCCCKAGIILENEGQRPLHLERRLSRVHRIRFDGKAAAAVVEDVSQMPDGADAFTGYLIFPTPGFLIANLRLCRGGRRDLGRADAQPRP